jgi:AraC-like DNA-binding protein
MGRSGVYANHADGVVRFEGIDSLNDESARSGFEFVQFEPGRLVAEYRMAHLPRIHFSVAHYSLWVLGKGAPPPGCGFVGFPPAGPQPVSPEGFAMADGCPYVPPGRDVIRMLPAGRTVVIAVLVHAALEEAAESRLGVPLSRIARHGIFSTMDSPARLRLRDLVERLTRRVTEERQGADLDPGVAAEIESEFLGALLDAAVPDGAVAERPDRTRLARKAALLLHDTAESPTALADVAQALRTTPRTLEAGFQEVFAVSPRRYRHCVRLQRARHDLRHAGGTDTVGDIAIRHGLLHLGRFSVTYREMFGESPAETLRRRRAARRLSA